MLVRTIARWALYLYFLRVPVVCWLAVTALGPAALALAPSFASGLFYATSGAALAITTAAVCIFSAACLATFNLIRIGSKLRFRFEIPMGRSVLFFAVAHLAPLSLCGSIIYASRIEGSPLPGWKIAAALALGYVIAGVLVALSRALQWLFAHPATTQLASLVLPGSPLPLLPAIRDFDPAPVRWIRSAGVWLGRWLNPLIGPVTKEGYLEEDILPAHIYAAALLVVMLAFDATLGAARQADIWPESYSSPLVRSVLHDLVSRVTLGLVTTEKIPALAWLMFPLTLAVWALSSLTYLLDRYRVPVLAAAALLAAMTSGTAVSDHFYRTEANAATPRPTATELLRARRNAGKKLVLVSAPGGGIQATVWATWILSQLEGEAGRNGVRLMPHVAAMSGVSGGAVGLFHLAAARFDPVRAHETAKLPAIADVSWGWMSPDRWNSIFPWIRKEVVDRGWALEFALERNARVPHARSLYLDDVKAGAEVPALLLNSTVMESGQPVVFSNSRFLDPPSGARPVCGPLRGSSGPVDFADLYGRRIRLVTAARLSASFPYVSPGARTFPEAPLCPDFHLLDGGYYDNYGVLMLMQWLRKAWDELPEPERPAQALLIRVYGFPDDRPLPSLQGWGAQTVIPLLGVLTARENSQAVVARETIRLTEKSLPGLTFQTADFNYANTGEGCEEPPLNWILTTRQLNCIEGTRWEGALKQNSDKVIGFLKSEAR